MLADYAYFLSGFPLDSFYLVKIKTSFLPMTGGKSKQKSKTKPCPQKSSDMCLLILFSMSSLHEDPGGTQFFYVKGQKD